MIHFSVTVEVEPKVSAEYLRNKISDALYWVEGTGKISVLQRDENGNWNEGVKE